MSNEEMRMTANPNPADLVGMPVYPGDLGRKPFVAHRMRPDGTLAMIYDSSPIRELEGALSATCARAEKPFTF